MCICAMSFLSDTSISELSSLFSKQRFKKEKTSIK